MRQVMVDGKKGEFVDWIKVDMGSHVGTVGLVVFENGRVGECRPRSICFAVRGRYDSDEAEETTKNSEPVA